MAVAAQLIFILLSLVSVSVSSDVVRLVGDSVQLDIQDPVPEFEDLSWKFNTVKNILKYYNESKKTRQHPDYKDRVEFNKKTYSLTLKNLQKNNSGLYEATASGAKVSLVAKYRLSVLDPVEAPVLTPTFHTLSNDTCNITLTCRGHDLSISSSCYNETCEEKEVTSPGGVALSLSVNGSTIICNHSNPVSWKEAVLELGKLCADEDEAGPGPHGVNSLFNWLWPVGGAILSIIILIVVFILLCACRRRSVDTTQCDTTVYAEVTDSRAGAQANALEAPSTVYGVVAKKPQPSSKGQSSQITPDPKHKQPTPVESSIFSIYETVPDQMEPQTIYDTVSKPANL